MNKLSIPAREGTEEMSKREWVIVNTRLGDDQRPHFIS